MADLTPSGPVRNVARDEADLSELEVRILLAAAADADEDFLRLAGEYGGLEKAQALVRMQGTVVRPVVSTRLEYGDAST